MAILYYIKEYTKYGDLYKIGVTYYDDSISVYQNVVRRYTAFRNEMEKGLKFDLLYFKIDKRNKIEKIENKIKLKFESDTYHGTRNLIHHSTEVFIVDVLKKDKYPKLFNVQQYERHWEVIIKEKKMIDEYHNQLLEHYNPLDEIMR